MNYNEKPDILNRIRNIKLRRELTVLLAFFVMLSTSYVMIHPGEALNNSTARTFMFFNEEEGTEVTEVPDMNALLDADRDAAAVEETPAEVTEEPVVQSETEAAEPTQTPAETVVPTLEPASTAEATAEATGTPETLESADPAVTAEAENTSDPFSTASTEPVIEETSTPEATASASPEPSASAAPEATTSAEPTATPEADEEEVLYPAVDFGEITPLEEDGTETKEDIKVVIKAPEGAFPEGTTVNVVLVRDTEVLEAIEKAAVDAAEDNVEVKEVKAVDITFTYKGEEIQPKKAIAVSFKSSMIEESKETTVVHVEQDKENNNEIVEAKAVDKIEAPEHSELVDEIKDNEVVIEADSFSVYGIVGTETISAPFTSSDGKTYEVTVNYGPEAGIPAGAELIVSELNEESEEYQKYLEQTADAVGTAADALNYLKILDISIMNGDQKVVIQAPVDVQIKLLDRGDSEEKQEGEKTKVVHFGESETDVIDPELNGTTVNFEASGFSYYAVTTYGATADLAGKSYAIVQVNTQATQDISVGNNTVYQGRALTTTAQSNNTRLAGATVSVETHKSGLNLVSSGTTQIVEWEFESVSDNTYYIKAPDGRYLNLTNNNALVLSNTAQALTVTAGTGDYAGKIRISDGNRKLRTNISANQTSSTDVPQFYCENTTNARNNYVWMTLCQIEEFNPDQYPVYSGEKISVQDLVDGQKYIIYKNIYNEMTGEYEDWVIDGNGNPVKAYDQGDSLSLHSEISPMWVLSILVDSSGQPTGYYIFRNEETGLILHPMADGTLVKEYDAATSPTQDGVSLKGREGGDYTSTIEYWDGSAMAYYGYQITTDGQVVISSGTGNNSQTFSFAEQKTSQEGLHEVATVDSESAGITIHMFNYPNRNTIANVTGSDSYGVGVIPSQHVRATLNSNGYPVFTNGNNGSTLFNPSNSYHQGTGNQLFLESVYDSTGYYEYSAFNNFAHYNNDGTFTVYQETGTPSTTSSNFYYRRGNFFPYNRLNTNNSAENIYTGDGALIDYENPSYGGSLYGFTQDPDFYFGMTMDFNFLMPKDGYEKGTPLIYEFNGDDDLWIYIDGVLILDIGGVHDAFPGTINFATGEIIGGNGGAGGARTIKGCFQKAGVFPDGTPWDNSKVDEYFDGDTFVSYGSHQFNMFYMEHGAGASNLQMRFNLPVIERGKVTVEKELDNTSQVDYANVSFAYQAFATDEHGAYQPLTSAVYEGTDTPLTFYNNVMIGENGPYDNVFYLKPREAAVFSDMIEDELYYVQEIGIKTDYYDEVLVNDVRIEGEQVIEEEGVYKSTEATARNRARVTFTNKLNEKNSNELRITKRLAEGSVDNGDTFEFRVMLENASGVLSAYYQGTYYIRDDDGVYYRYEGGNLVPNGQTPYACTAGNYGTIAQIPPDFTVVIKDLVSDTDFYVDEIRVRPNGSSSDVLIGESDWTLVRTDVTDAAEGEITDADIYDYATGTTIQGSSMGRIELEKDAQVTFTNKYSSADVELKKVKEDGTTTISGSTFDLSKYVNNTWSNIVQEGISPGAAAIGETPAVENPVNLGSLPLGKYRLTETAAPTGYIILTKHIYFEVFKDTDKAVKVRFIKEDGTPLSEAEIAELSTTVTITPPAGDDATYTITVINKPGAQLPMTGGSGTLPYTLGGLTVMLTALMYGFRMRRRERRLN